MAVKALVRLFLCFGSAALRASLHAMFLLAAVLSHGAAFGAEAWQEYDKLIDKQRTPVTLGAELFGDQVDLNSGALTFTTTDISIPGNNALPVALTRTYRIRSGSGYPDPATPPDDLHFGDWELALPRIEGVFPETTGWVNGNPSKGENRCSVANMDEARARTVQVNSSWFQGGSI